MNIYHSIRRFFIRSVYGAIALPLGLAAPISTRASRLQRRLLGINPGPYSRDQARRYSRASLPANIATSALLLPVWSIFIANGFLYPVFDAGNLEDSWGGPSLAGAWLAHWIQGPPLLILATLLLWPVSQLQARLARKHLSGVST